MVQSVEPQVQFEVPEFSSRPYAKNVDIRLSPARMSSDAGLLAFFQLDQFLGITEDFADILKTSRPPGALHTPLSLLRQRVYGLLAGYEDQNDHDRLRLDPIFQYVAGDKENLSHELASQPTLSRFENSVTKDMVFQMRETMLDQFVASFESDPGRITLDIDAFADPTHGHQQLTLFCAFEDQYQYFPLAITCAENDLVAMASLRHGTARACLGAEDDLWMVVTRLRERFPDLEIHVRGDSGFGMPSMYQMCEQLGIFYTFGFTMNKKVKRLSGKTLGEAILKYQENVANGLANPKARLFCTHMYRAGSWKHPRRLIVKSEVHAGGTNQRAVITNRPGGERYSEATYDAYVDRGESENRNKEVKCEMYGERLSCHRFVANYFRLLMSTIASNLVVRMRQITSLGITPADVGIESELPPEALPKEDQKTFQNRRRSRDPYGEAFASTWRQKLIKVAGMVVISSRRVLLELSQSWPHLNGLFRICESLKAYFATHARPQWRSAGAASLG